MQAFRLDLCPAMWLSAEISSGGSFDPEVMINYLIPSGKPGVEDEEYSVVLEPSVAREIVAFLAYTFAAGGEPLNLPSYESDGTFAIPRGVDPTAWEEDLTEYEDDNLAEFDDDEHS